MIGCVLCERTFQDKRGLSAHIRKEHKEIKWNKYKDKYPLTEVQAIKVPVDDSKEPDHTDIGERLERLETIVTTLVGGNTPGITDFPGDVYEIVGEKINYKVALDPAIFSTYNKFKAVCEKRGNPWTLDFSDFLKLAVKDSMTVQGIYDILLEMPGNRVIVEMPPGVR